MSRKLNITVMSSFLFLSALSALAHRSPAPSSSSSSSSSSSAGAARPSVASEDGLGLVKDLGEFWERYRLLPEWKRIILGTGLGVADFLSEPPPETAARILRSSPIAIQADIEIALRSERSLRAFMAGTSSVRYRPAASIEEFVTLYGLSTGVREFLTGAGFASIDELLDLLTRKHLVRSELFPSGLMPICDWLPLANALDMERVLRPMYAEIKDPGAAKLGASLAGRDLEDFWKNHGLDKGDTGPYFVLFKSNYSFRHFLSTPMVPALAKTCGSMNARARAQLEKAIAREQQLRRISSAGQGAALAVSIGAERVEDLFSVRYGYHFPKAFTDDLKEQGFATTRELLLGNRTKVTEIIKKLKTPVERLRAERVIQLEELIDSIRVSRGGETAAADRAAAAGSVSAGAAGAGASPVESKEPATGGVAPATTVDNYWTRYGLPEGYRAWAGRVLSFDDWIAKHSTPAESGASSVGSSVAERSAPAERGIGVVEATIGTFKSPARDDMEIAGRRERLLREYIRVYDVKSGRYEPTSDLANFLTQYGLPSTLRAKFAEAGVASADDLVMFASDKALKDGIFAWMPAGDRNKLEVALVFERELRPLHRILQILKLPGTALEPLPGASTELRGFFQSRGLDKKVDTAPLCKLMPAWGFELYHFLQSPPLKEVDKMINGFSLGIRTAFQQAIEEERHLRRIIAVGQFDALKKDIGAEPVRELLLRYRIGITPKFVEELTRELAEAGFEKTVDIVRASSADVSDELGKIKILPRDSFIYARVWWIFETERMVNEYRKSSR